VESSRSAATRAPSPVESGFIAAGVTISMIAGMQSVGIVLRWIFFGG